MSNFPADLANEALDAAGVDFSIGEITEGSKASIAVLRKYGQCMRALMRAAHWDQFRKMAPLTLLADATGQAEGVGTVVVPPWTYEYALPADCVLPRFIPWNALPLQSAIPATNTQIADVPQTGASQTTYQPGVRLIPAPYLMTTDTNYPVDTSTLEGWINMPGVSPAGRIVICTNVQQASMVYTQFMPYPNMWSADFRQAFVAYLASEIALPLAMDKRFGMQLRNENIKIAMQKIMAARVTSANDGSQPQSTDIIPDWINIRGSGFGGGPWWGGPGWSGVGGCAAGYGGWSSIAFANGSVF